MPDQREAGACQDGGIIRSLWANSSVAGYIKIYIYMTYARLAQSFACEQHFNSEATIHKTIIDSSY